MKKLVNKILGIFSVVVLLASCGPDDAILLTTDIIQDAADADNYIESIYEEMTERSMFENTYSIVPMIYSDQAKYLGNSNNDWEDASAFNFEADNSLINQMFTESYIINSANLQVLFAQIDTTEDVTLTDAVKDGFRAEGKAIRAMLYFYLTNFWGEVPLVLYEDDESTVDSLRESATISEVYDQIISDLTFADENLNNAYSFGTQRLNEFAVKGWLARVYLYDGNWQNALDYAEAVIDNSSFSLEPNLSNVYSIASSENMFIMVEEEVDISLAVWFLQTFANGQHVIQPRDNSFFEANDNRKDIALSQPGTTIIKYDDISNNTDPVYMMRLPEMYLIAAEAAIRLNDDYDKAEGYINDLRSRAGLADVELNVGNFEAIILNERSAELCYEGMHRWLDLKRMGLDNDVLSTYGYSATDNLWPFPENFLEVFKSVEQNDGY